MFTKVFKLTGTYCLHPIYLLFSQFFNISIDKQKWSRNIHIWMYINMYNIYVNLLTYVHTYICMNLNDLHKIYCAQYPHYSFKLLKVFNFITEMFWVKDIQMHFKFYHIGYVFKCMYIHTYIYYFPITAFMIEYIHTYIHKHVDTHTLSRACHITIWLIRIEQLIHSYLMFVYKHTLIYTYVHMYL